MLLGSNTCSHKGNNLHYIIRLRLSRINRFPLKPDVFDCLHVPTLFIIMKLQQRVINDNSLINASSYQTSAKSRCSKHKVLCSNSHRILWKQQIISKLLNTDLPYVWQFYINTTNNSSLVAAILISLLNLYIDFFLKTK